MAWHPPRGDRVPYGERTGGTLSIPLTSTTPDPHLIDLKWGFLLDSFSFKIAGNF